MAGDGLFEIAFGAAVEGHGGASLLEDLQGFGEQTRAQRIAGQEPGDDAGIGLDEDLVAVAGSGDEAVEVTGRFGARYVNNRHGTMILVFGISGRGRVRAGCGVRRGDRAYSLGEASTTYDGQSTFARREKMAYKKSTVPLRYSVSLVSQGKHRFYTLTMPSDVLANTCFVSTREEDPKKGFQRLLDEKRAQQIADYIDLGFGTIPTSIVLSAQASANLKIIGSGKTLEFTEHPKAFLILDGQHRVFGFSLAKTALRVPVVIYNNLTPRDESRLFIDINTKQRPVPNELLLDIKRLAEYQSEVEQFNGRNFRLL